MTRNDDFARLFNHLNGLSVGFGDVFRDFHEPAVSYPPHNIYQIERNPGSEPKTAKEFEQPCNIVLELAVAGFKKNEIIVTERQGEVTIQGLKGDTITAPDYQHRGIATRNFIKRFRLAEYYEVFDAKLEDGMLTIIFVKNAPEDKSKLITIK